MAPAAELYCRVEVPKGAPVLRANVQEAAPASGSEVRCPADWCHFPDTLARDGAALGAIVCASERGAAGRQVAVRPIALLRTHDTRGYEEIVVCVAAGDPTWAAVESIQGIPGELRAEIERFVMSKAPRRGHVSITGWLSRDDAMTAIDDAAARWAGTVNGRG